MTQVPASSHGGGTFNGGTITAPLVIDLTGKADATALSVIGANNGSSSLIQASAGGGATVFQAQQVGGAAQGIYAASTHAGSEGLYVDGSAGTAAAVAFANGGSRQAGYDKDVRPFSNPVAPTTVQLVSGTGAQISTSYDAELHTPVTFNPGVATTATCTVAISPDNVTYTTLAVVTKPVGTVFDGEIDDVVVSVPKAWYVKLTVNAQATLGLSTYF